MVTVGAASHPLGLNAYGNTFERFFFYRGDTGGLPYVEVAATGFNASFDNCTWSGGASSSVAVELNNRAVSSTRPSPADRGEAVGDR